MKRILILVTQFELAGAQKVALTQARHFHHQGYEVVACFLYDKYELLQTITKQEPFEIISLQAKLPDKSPVSNIFFTVRAIWRLFWLLKRKRIQVIETLTHYSNLLGIIVAWLAKVPVRISSQRNTLPGYPKWLLWMDAKLVNSKLVDKMIAVSEETRGFCIDVEGMSPSKVVTILNGIDLTSYQSTKEEIEASLSLRMALNIPINAPVLITVARLHPQKGHVYLIDAASYILEKFPETIFVFAGDGEERHNIEHHIHKVGLTNQFRLLGVRKDIPLLLRMSNLFVLPSLYEGLPNVVLEAMASELAVVATKVDGNQEIIVDQETGLLVPKADANSLAQAIISLLENKERRKQMGLNGYYRVSEHFSEKVMCQRYEETMLSIFQEKSSYDH